MRILDSSGAELKNPDITKGRLVPERIAVKHHEAVAAVAEQGHFELLREYPNGGRDLRWVVDRPAVEGKEAWVSYEDILRYLPLTEQQQAHCRMRELKQLLRDTDYRILKVVEGATTLSQIAQTLLERAAWRKEYNELEEAFGNEE